MKERTFIPGVPQDLQFEIGDDSWALLTDGKRYPCSREEQHRIRALQMQECLLVNEVLSRGPAS